MSDVEKLYHHILKDSQLQARLRAMQVQSQEEAIPALIAIAEEQGYNVTTEDIHQFIEIQKQRFESEDAELSDEELALVAAAGTGLTEEQAQILYDAYQDDLYEQIGQSGLL